MKIHSLLCVVCVPDDEGELNRNVCIQKQFTWFI